MGFLQQSYCFMCQPLLLCALRVAWLQGASGNHPFHPVRGGLLVCGGTGTLDVWVISALSSLTSHRLPGWLTWADVVCCLERPVFWRLPCCLGAVVAGPQSQQETPSLLPLLFIRISDFSHYLHATQWSPLSLSRASGLLWLEVEKEGGKG